MSVDEFLAWDPEDGVRCELVDGEPRAMAPASLVHGLLQGELCALIRNHLRAHRPHCRALVAPGVIPRLMSAHNVRIPDLGVTCSPVRPGMATLPDPLVLVEIISPSNQAETWSNVWTFTSIPSVREILILHGNRIAGEMLRRAPDGGWPERTRDLSDSRLHLESIGFEVPLADVYAETGLTP